MGVSVRHHCDGCKRLTNLAALRLFDFTRKPDWSRDGAHIEGGTVNREWLFCSLCTARVLLLFEGLRSK